MAVVGAWTAAAPFFFGAPSAIIAWSNFATGTAIAVYALWMIYGAGGGAAR